MALDGITSTYITEFNSDLQLLLQQRVSKFLPTVTQGSHTGDQASFVDQLAAFDLEEKTTKLAQHELEEYDMYRRWVLPTDYRKALGVDWSDLLRAIQDPTSQLAQNSVAAYNRRVDDTIIQALIGNSYRGTKGPTETVALGASQTIVDGSVGMTFGKVRAAHEAMLEANLDPAYDDMYLAIAPKHLTQLYEAVDEYDGEELKAVRDLQSGMLAKLYGFNVFVSTRLEVATGAASKTTIPAIAYERNALHFGNWKPLGIRVDERVDLDMAKQVYVAASFGATRREEERVVKINNNG